MICIAPDDEIDGSCIPFAFLFYTNMKRWNFIEA